MNNYRLKLFFGPSLVALLLAGCMVGPKYHQPAATVQPPPAATRGSSSEPLDDLAQYEEEDAHIDYRHRMLMNVIAVMIVSSLVGVGVWIADTITDMEKTQDCLMQGRQNCAPITMLEKK